MALRPLKAQLLVKTIIKKKDLEIKIILSNKKIETSCMTVLKSASKEEKEVTIEVESKGNQLSSNIDIEDEKNKKLLSILKQGSTLAKP